jgi:hypothetical protein
MARREWNVAGNGQFGRLAKSAGVRRNPQQHAGTGAIRQEKTPTENGWGFVIGPGGFEPAANPVFSMLPARRLPLSCHWLHGAAVVVAVR